MVLIQERVTHKDIREGPAAGWLYWSPQMDPEENKEGSLGNSTGVAHLITPLDTQLAQQKLYKKVWPELAVRSSNLSGPAQSRPVKIALGLPQQVISKPESYATACKKSRRQVSGLPSTGCAEKRNSSTPSGGSTSNGQSAIKMAGDHSARSKKPPSPVATCRVNGIRTLSPPVGRTSTEGGRQTAKISPIRPPREKRVRLDKPSRSST